ncbi:MAG: hypothetical protein WCH99_17450 [Verrucomicrobiota bacterium]
MKAPNIFLLRLRNIAGLHAANGCLAVVLAAFAGLSCGLTICQAQPADGDAAGAQVLTRGPVHEAFAETVSFNPEPGIVVAKTPPDVIEEMPPDVKPEGDNVTWIPGYWAWDDERNDFLWVSGTWRALPPGRAWIAGYWGTTSQGHQWTSGYWADAAANETTYLPAPPATVESGPNIEAPSPDYWWTPGCWVWYEGRYAWGPGYWMPGRADWNWCPSHYVWTPRGYIFVGGFWDYPIERRGVLFAPVYFETGGYYGRPGYVYSPTIVINLGVFSDHLFLRPSYGHYYFGDYYAPSYLQSGFYASFSFQSSRHGYDPIYSHQRWEHRQDHEWEHRVETSYQNRRDHESERPPRTWVAERSLNQATAESKISHRMAAPINQLAKQKAGAVKFQPVFEAERQKLAQRSQAVQQSRDQRRTIETKLVDTAGQKSGGLFAPAKVPLPRSPIVSKPVSQLRKNQIPPQAQPSPKPDSIFQPKPDAPVRQSGVNRINPQPEPRLSGSEMKPIQPRLNEAIPRARAVLPEAPPRVLEPRPKSHDESPPSVSGSEQSASPVTPPSARPRLDPNEKGAARLIRNYQSSAGNGSQPAPRSSPAPPRAIENPAAGGNNGPSPMDKEREKSAKD